MTIRERILERRVNFIRRNGFSPLRLYISTKLFHEMKEETPSNDGFDLRLESPQIFGMGIFLVINDEDHLEVV